MANLVGNASDNGLVGVILGLKVGGLSGGVGPVAMTSGSSSGDSKEKNSSSSSGNRVRYSVNLTWGLGNCSFALLAIAGSVFCRKRLSFCGDLWPVAVSTSSLIVGRAGVIGTEGVECVIGGVGIVLGLAPVWLCVVVVVVGVFVDMTGVTGDCFKSSDV